MSNDEKKEDLNDYNHSKLRIIPFKKNKSPTIQVIEDEDKVCIEIIFKSNVKEIVEINHQDILVISGSYFTKSFNISKAEYKITEVSYDFPGLRVVLMKS